MRLDFSVGRCGDQVQRQDQRHQRQRGSPGARDQAILRLPDVGEDLQG
jgi:hypothetical protein